MLIRCGRRSPRAGRALWTTVQLGPIWGWSPEFDLAAMTKDMIERVGARIGVVRAD
jgi:hypothetical protein